MRIVEAFEEEGADAWYKPGAAERFLGHRAQEGWKKVDDILDVWFDSGSTHAFLAQLRASKGRIINIASIQSFVHVRTPSSTAYTAS